MYINASFNREKYIRLFPQKKLFQLIFWDILFLKFKYLSVHFLNAIRCSFRCGFVLSFFQRVKNFKQSVSSRGLSYLISAMQYNS